MVRRKGFDYEHPPKKLDGHIFYGLTLDAEQTAFRDAIWDEEKEIVFVDAPAGTGKTLLAIATSTLLVRSHRYDEIVYVMHSVGDAQGFLPGTISEKSSVWFEPLYQALESIDEDPERVIKGSSMASMDAQKNGEAFITALTTTYLRGSNIGGGDKKTILIVDEAQNYTEFALRKTLTRACEGTKVIVIGHRLQCDLAFQGDSGFTKCMAHFVAKEDERVSVCRLTQSHRGFVAKTADEAWLPEEFNRNIRFGS